MYLLWVLSFFKPVPPKTQNSLDKLACFTHANVLLSSVNQSTYLLGNLLFFMAHVSHFIAGTIHLVPVLSQNVRVGEGPGATL